MNKVILITLLGLFIISCDVKKETPKIPTQITKEFLWGKEFIADKKQLMGSKHFHFTDTNKVHYYIRDKRAYGYNGTYSFEYDSKGNQFIKITEKKDKLMVILLVKSTTQLEITKVKPEVYNPATVSSFDIKHQIGKIYTLRKRD